MATNLLRLAQALPLPVGFLYFAWWVGVGALAVGLGLGLLINLHAPAVRRIGVPALAAGLVSMAALVARHAT